MLDLNILGDYIVLLVVGICVCIGYVIKTSFDFINNKYIPCIMTILGCVLNIWVAGDISPEIILGGMLSGLASTGLHQTFKNLKRGEKNE